MPDSARAWAVIWGMGFFGIFLYGLCFFFGLQHIPAGRGALVVALNPVMNDEMSITVIATGFDDHAANVVLAHLADGLTNCGRCGKRVGAREFRWDGLWPELLPVFAQEEERDEHIERV